MKAEKGKADPVGCRAYWGKGEGASTANETLRLCLKERAHEVYHCRVPDGTVVFQ